MEAPVRGPGCSELEGTSPGARGATSGSPRRLTRTPASPARHTLAPKPLVPWAVGTQGAVCVDRSGPTRGSLPIARRPCGAVHPSRPSLHLVLSQLGPADLDRTCPSQAPSPPTPASRRQRLQSLPAQIRSYKSLSLPAASGTNGPPLATVERQRLPAERRRRVSPWSQRPRGTGSCSDKQGMDAGFSQLAGCPPPPVGPPPLPWGGHRQVPHLPPGG